MNLLSKDIFPTEAHLEQLSPGALDTLSVINLKVHAGELTGIQMYFESGTFSPLV